MHFALGSAKPTRQSNPSKYVVDEINAYIAIRDGLMVEAEQVRTRAKLDSVIAANDFVETCLKPARPAYKAQHLREADAVHERKRCQAVKARVAELRANLAVDRRSLAFSR
jgi:hypothetical protein